MRFQSQVAILGWGYPSPTSWTSHEVSFNRRWRFLGGDTRPCRLRKPREPRSFNRRWRFLGGDTITECTCRHCGAVSIAGGDSWVGIPGLPFGLIVVPESFNRRWRFLGGDTGDDGRDKAKAMVSIAGGDSWVGIPKGDVKVGDTISVSIAGGDSWVGIHSNRSHIPCECDSFNRRWRFLGGDTLVIGNAPPTSLWFQSQVAILGWGYCIAYVYAIATF